MRTPEELCEELLHLRWPDVEIDWAEVMRTVLTFGALAKPGEAKKTKRGRPPDQAAEDHEVSVPQATTGTGVARINGALLSGEHSVTYLRKLAGYGSSSPVVKALDALGARETTGLPARDKRRRYTLLGVKASRPALPLKRGRPAYADAVRDLLKTGKFSHQQIKDRLNLPEKHNLSSTLSTVRAIETTGASAGSGLRRYTLMEMDARAKHKSPKRSQHASGAAARIAAEGAREALAGGREIHAMALAKKLGVDSVTLRKEMTKLGASKVGTGPNIKWILVSPPSTSPDEMRADS